VAVFFDVEHEFAISRTRMAMKNNNRLCMVRIKKLSKLQFFSITPELLI